MDRRTLAGKKGGESYSSCSPTYISIIYFFQKFHTQSNFLFVKSILRLSGYVQQKFFTLQCATICPSHHINVFAFNATHTSCKSVPSRVPWTVESLFDRSFTLNSVIKCNRLREYQMVSSHAAWQFLGSKVPQVGTGGPLTTCLQAPLCFAQTNSCFEEQIRNNIKATID